MEGGIPFVCIPIGTSAVLDKSAFGLLPPLIFQSTSLLEQKFHRATVVENC
jgi:hypothetical protein